VFRSFVDTTDAAKWPGCALGFISGGSANNWTFTQVDTTHGLPVAIVGSVVVNAGTNLNTSLLALESGGNLAALAGIIHGGAASVTANAGTNLNTSLLALEAGGNLAAAKADLDTLAGAISGGHMLVTLAGQTGNPTVTFTNTSIAISGTSTVTVTGALPAGTNVLGHVIVDSGTLTTVSTVTTVSAVTSITNPVTSNPAAAATGGATGFTLAQSAASNNATNVKNAAGTLYQIDAYNLAAYPVYIKLYNKATTPAPASDTPVRTIMVPANATPANGAGVVVNFGPAGLALGTGIGYAITKGQAANDNTAVLLGDCTLNGSYA
jgi:hypothetical protein